MSRPSQNVDCCHRTMYRLQLAGYGQFLASVSGPHPRAGLLDLLCTTAMLELAALLQRTQDPCSQNSSAAIEAGCRQPACVMSRQLTVKQHRFNLKRIEFVLMDLKQHHMFVNEAVGCEFAGSIVMQHIHEALQCSYSDTLR